MRSKIKLFDKSRPRQPIRSRMRRARAEERPLDFRRQGGGGFLHLCLRLLSFCNEQRRFAQARSGVPPPKTLGVEPRQRRTFEGLF